MLPSYAGSTHTVWKRVHKTSMWTVKAARIIVSQCTHNDSSFILWVNEKIGRQAQSWLLAITSDVLVYRMNPIHQLSFEKNLFFPLWTLFLLCIPSLADFDSYASCLVILLSLSHWKKNNVCYIRSLSSLFHSNFFWLISELDSWQVCYILK